MNNNVFLSWSGKLSNGIAYAFHEYLPLIIQNSRPFFSPESISKDADWFHKIKNELINVQTGIIFLTKENIKSEWIIFEAGGILSKNSICVLLCDLEISDLKGTVFQNLNATRLNDKSDLLKLFHTLKNVISSEVTEDVLSKTFEKFYNDLKDEIENNKNKILSTSPDNSIFEKLTGKWKLAYTKVGDSFRGQELLKLDASGKYFLIDQSDEKYYFQLGVLSSNDNNYRWQKIQVIDGKATNMVHSIENLKLSNDGTVTMIGSDTSGFNLTYTKLD